MVTDEVRRFFFYLQEAMRKVLDEIQQFAAVDLADVSIFGVCPISERYKFLYTLCEHYCNAEKKIRESLLEIDNMVLRETADQDEAEEFIPRIYSALSELSAVYENVTRDDNNNNDVDSEVRKYNEVATKLHELCKATKLFQDQHISGDEDELLGLFQINFSLEQQEKIFGKILGNCSTKMLESMLRWATSTLSHDENQQMIGTWFYITRRTRFSRWLSACLGKTLHLIMNQDPLSGWLFELRKLNLLSSDEEESEEEEEFDMPIAQGKYYCPFCHMIRVGQGPGVDVFHCMTCNGCMAYELEDHICIENCYDGECPICLEDFFEKAGSKLPCGHVLHRDCYEAYARNECPVCKRSF